MNLFLSLSIILEYENQEELHVVVCLFLHDSHFQIKHLKALLSFQFPLSKYYTIPMQLLPWKIQRQEDWWYKMARAHNPVNVSFIYRMKYQVSQLSKLLLHFNPSKQREFESCSVQCVDGLLEQGCCRAGHLALPSVRQLVPPRAGNLIRVKLWLISLGVIQEHILCLGAQWT